jgi:hypothetical protein
MGGPMAYWGASRGFDAVAFAAPMQATVTLALGWAIAMAVFVVIARSFNPSVAMKPGVSA